MLITLSLDCSNFNCVCVICCRYTPSSNQWTCVTKIRTPRSEFGCAAMKEKIFLVGGYNWNTSKRLGEIECFDTETLAWTTIPAQEQALVGVAAAVITVFEKNKFHK